MAEGSRNQSVKDNGTDRSGHNQYSGSVGRCKLDYDGIRFTAGRYFITADFYRRVTGIKVEEALFSAQAIEKMERGKRP